MVETGGVWFSKFHALNDPMEGVYYTIDKDEKKTLTAILKNQFVLGCFGQSNNNHHLWAYYANGYSGACIEFEVDKTLINLKKDIKTINYIDPADLEKTTSPVNEEEIKNLINRKLNFWEPENEVRIILKPKDYFSGKGCKINIGKIKEICFGVNICEETFDLFLLNERFFENLEGVSWDIKEPGKKLIRHNSFHRLVSDISEYRNWRKSFS